MSANNVKRYVMAAAMGEAIAFPQGPGALADAWVDTIAAEETATEFVLATDYDALAASHAELREALELIQHNAVPHGRTDQLIALIRRINHEASAALTHAKQVTP